MTDTTATQTADTDTVASTRMTPTELRELREKLSVSRATLVKATGLSSSVIWRAEQEDTQPVTTEQYLDIEAVLVKWMTNGVPAEYAKPKREHVAASTAVADHTQCQADYEKISEFVIYLSGRVEQLLEDARGAKRATKDLKAVQAELAEFRTENTI